ncbi:MAG: hypothetical protein JOZ15_15365 [Acidobacteria bacterium]|nr:hypothetical protein [Acidobacteriota bacterium]
MCRLAVLATLVTVALPAAAAAQDLYNWSVGVMGGVGGSVDVKPGSRNFSNGTWQVEGLVLTEPRTFLGLRLGHLALGAKDTLFGSRVGADLSYVTLAGQYMFEESYYDSGVYLGLGAYRLGGNDAVTGASASKTVAGGVLGLTGDFKASRRFSVVVEVSGHYIDVRNAHIYAMAHGGLAWHF